jgi:hypothetical protein
MEEIGYADNCQWYQGRRARQGPTHIYKTQDDKWKVKQECQKRCLRINCENWRIEYCIGGPENCSLTV